MSAPAAALVCAHECLHWQQEIASDPWGQPSNCASMCSWAMGTATDAAAHSDCTFPSVEQCFVVATATAELRWFQQLTKAVQASGMVRRRPCCCTTRSPRCKPASCPDLRAETRTWRRRRHAWICGMLILGVRRHGLSQVAAIERNLGSDASALWQQYPIPPLILIGPPSCESWAHAW